MSIANTDSIAKTNYIPHIGSIYINTDGSMASNNRIASSGKNIKHSSTTITAAWRALMRSKQEWYSKHFQHTSEHDNNARMATTGNTNA